MGVFMSEFFPEPITKLPEADIPLAGLKAHLSQSENHQVLFMPCRIKGSFITIRKPSSFIYAV
jgi:hypothetical protein